METKFTKGEWILRENLSTIMSEENCLIARVFDGKGIALLENKEQSDEIVTANALLISKAPEMFEMLESILELQKENYGSGMNTHLALITKSKEIEQLLKEATEL